MQDQNNQDNVNISKFYCRIEIFCNSNLKILGFNRDKCFDVRDDSDYNQDDDYDVFAKEFDNFTSVIDSLCEIELAWEKLQSYRKDISESDVEYGASVMIYNQWKSGLYIGMYDNRWALPRLSPYTNEWKENYARSVMNKSGSLVILHIPFYHEQFMDDFISKDKACSLLKEWLEKNEYAVDFNENEVIRYLQHF
jgi:hypothetical protein